MPSESRRWRRPSSVSALPNLFNTFGRLDAACAWWWRTVGVWVRSWTTARGGSTWLSRVASSQRFTRSVSQQDRQSCRSALVVLSRRSCLRCRAGAGPVHTRASLNPAVTSNTNHPQQARRLGVSGLQSCAWRSVPIVASRVTEWLGGGLISSTPVGFRRPRPIDMSTAATDTAGRGAGVMQVRVVRPDHHLAVPRPSSQARLDPPPGHA
jgi:hypothetical protein